MQTVVDTLLIDAAQLVTCAGNGSPKRGLQMHDPQIIERGALAIDAGRIVALGSSAEIRARYRARETISAQGGAVVPGFVDCHTHVIYGGNRIAEFEERLSGVSYLDILGRGGGINSTVRATRAASDADLIEQAAFRLRAMLQNGTTTVEVKTGYGLDTQTEIRMLRVLDVLRTVQPCDLIPTFLGAHAIPPEFAGDPTAYAEHVATVMTAEFYAAWRETSFARDHLPLFVDVFTEKNAFDVAQSMRVLRAGQQFGMQIKAHVDEFNALGGLELALELGARSVDHLDVTAPAHLQRLAQTDTAAVMMPAVNFHLGSLHYANARGLIDAGGILALATDINPGSAPCSSMPFIIALACRAMKITPAEALHAATINAAYAIGLQERFGSLEVGKWADCAILHGADYRVLAYEFGGNPVRSVIKRGKVVA